ncbi:MAG: DUF99 family protein [Desulfurococcales archaeon]|nr:DUF99 family protein [Desulfurococcales archaeon]
MPQRIVVACDDGIVNKLGEGVTIVACTLYNKNLGPVHVGFLPVKIDGLDATGQLLYLINTLNSLYPDNNIEAVLFDSLTIAGFNIISPASINKHLGLPVIVLYKRKPNVDKIINAVVKYIKYPEIRLRVLRLLENTVVLDTKHGRLYSVLYGINPKKALPIIEYYQLHSRIPEPLRFIDYFASSVSRLLLGM